MRTRDLLVSAIPMAAIFVFVSTTLAESLDIPVSFTVDDSGVVKEEGPSDTGGTGGGTPIDPGPIDIPPYLYCTYINPDFPQPEPQPAPRPRCNDEEKVTRFVELTTQLGVTGMQEYKESLIKEVSECLAVDIVETEPLSFWNPETCPRMECNEELNSCSHEVKNTRAELAESQSALQDMRIKLAEVSAELSDAREVIKGLEYKKAELEKANSALTKENAALASELSEAKAKLEKMQLLIDGLMAEKTELQTQVSTLEIQIARYQARLEAARVNIAELEEKVLKRDRAIRILEVRNQELVDEVGNLTEENQALENSIAELNSENLRLQRRLRACEAPAPSPTPQDTPRKKDIPEVIGSDGDIVAIAIPDKNDKKGDKKEDKKVKRLKKRLINADKASKKVSYDKSKEESKKERGGK